MKIKDKIYHWLVKKNFRVNEEYEKYVSSHLEEHKQNRLRHWLLLIKLNWHHRVCKKAEPYFVEFVKNSITSANDKAVSSEMADEKQDSMPAKVIPESKYLLRLSPVQLARQLLKYDVISFDVFDTLIFRPFREPFDLFDIVGAELHIANFKVLRCKAEAVARDETVKCNRQVDIYEIYGVLARYVKIDIDVAIKKELEVEKQLCFANSYMKQVFSILKLNGKEIIVLSDMYWPENILTELLNGCGYDGFAKVAVSCDMQAGKGNGELQRRARKLMGAGKSYVHVGDNFSSDILASRKMGWDAIHYPNINSIRDKVYKPFSNHIDASTYFGIIATHIHSGLMNRNKYYQHGFIYGGIMVEGYCEFLEDLVNKNGIDKLLFVSRDANILWKIYKKFFNTVNAEYIMWSRLAAYTTTFSEFTEDIIQHCIHDRVADKSIVTIEDMLDETGLSCAKDILSKNGFALKTLISEKNSSLIMDILYKNRNLISKEFKKCKQIAKEYFKGIIKDSKSICIVDIGWRGTTLIQLKALLNEWFPNVKIKLALAGLSMVGSSFCTTNYINGDIYPYMFSSEQNRDLFAMHFNPKMPLNNSMTEIMFGVPQPSFIKFSGVQDSGYNLEFSDAEIPNFNISRDIQSGIEDFVKVFHKLLGEYKKYIRISPYTAYLPLYQVLSCNEYIKELFSEYEMNLSTGKFSKDNRTVIGDYIKRWNL